MSDETRANNPLTPEVVPPAAPPRQRGVRVAELGRRPSEVFLGPGVSTSVRDIIEQGFISNSGDVQVYVNNREIPHSEFNTANIVDGDNIVAVRKVVAG